MEVDETADKIAHWSRVCIAISIGSFKGLIAALITAPVVAILATATIGASAGLWLGVATFFVVQMGMMLQAGWDKHEEMME